MSPLLSAVTWMVFLSPAITQDGIAASVFTVSSSAASVSVSAAAPFSAKAVAPPAAQRKAAHKRAAAPLIQRFFIIASASNSVKVLLSYHNGSGSLIQ